MRSLRGISCSIFFLLACVASVAAQRSPVAVAPMQFRGPMPVIEVKLNGQGPFMFAVDTRAGLQADIDTSIAERLRLTSIGKMRSGDPSGMNDRDLDAATIA